MPEDYYTPKGLNSVDMAQLADKYRQQFEIVHVDLVNIVELLEFKIPELIPGFRLVVCQDASLDVLARTSTHPPKIFVKETVYEAACEGDSNCRFILAHELGHLLLHRDRGSSLQKSFELYDEQFANLNSVESAEKQADMFARHLLIPPSLAYHYKHDPTKLSEVSGTPLAIAKGSITLAKRAQMRGIDRWAKARISEPISRASSTPVCDQDAALEKENTIDDHLKSTGKQMEFFFVEQQID